MSARIPGGGGRRTEPHIFEGTPPSLCAQNRAETCTKAVIRHPNAETARIAPQSRHPRKCLNLL